MARLTDYYENSGGQDNKVIPDTYNFITPYQDDSNITIDWVVGPGGDDTRTDLYVVWNDYLTNNPGLQPNEHVNFLLKAGVTYTLSGDPLIGGATYPVMNIIGEDPNNLSIIDQGS